MKLLMCMTSNRPGHTLPNTRRYAVSFERKIIGKNVIIYPHVSGYFWIRNFSLADSSPTRIRCNPKLFVSALQSENVEYAMKSGYFFIQWCHKIKASSLQWIFKAVPCAMLWLLYFLDFNFKCATSRRERLNPDTCRRPNSIWIPDVWTWKFLNL